MRYLYITLFLFINSCAVVDYFDGSCERNGKTYQDGETFHLNEVTSINDDGSKNIDCKDYICEDGKIKQTPTQNLMGCIEL